MKKILFLMLAALAITGCGTNDDEVQQGNHVTVTDNIYIPADEFHYGANFLSLRKYNKEGKVLMEKELTPPSEKSVNLPYGETMTLAYHEPTWGYFVNNKILLIWNPKEYYNESTELISEIQSFTEELELTKKRDFILIQKPLEYGENLLIKYFGSKYEIVNSNLTTLKEGTIDGKFVIGNKTQYIKENILLSFYENEVVLYSLDEGILWNYNVEKYIQSLYPNETQDIKLEITKITCDNGFILSQFKLTFYDGSNKNISLKLSMGGEVIKS